MLCGVLVGAIAGKAVQRSDSAYETHAPERVVAAMPGVGAGWLDTLRRVAGPTMVDTITPIMAYDDGPTLLGVFEVWHNLVNIRTDLKEYFQFQRNVCASRSFGYQHPVTLATPAAVIAHEFGHRFQLALWPHGIPGFAGDTLPPYAQDFEERFADRFARAMLALRGWDVPDTLDVMLNHVVAFRLRSSYWTP